MHHINDTLKPFTAVLAQEKCLWMLFLQELLFSSTKPQPTVLYWNIQDNPKSSVELLPLKNKEPVRDKCLLSVGGSVCAV